MTIFLIYVSIMVGGIQAYRLKDKGLTSQRAILFSAPVLALAFIVFLFVIPHIAILLIGYERTCDLRIFKGCPAQQPATWLFVKGAISSVLPLFVASLVGSVIGVLAAKHK